MKLDAELLHRLVVLRQHLSGMGSPRVGLPERGAGTFYYPLATNGMGLVVDEMRGSADIVGGDGKTMGGVPDLSWPNQFASILQNVDVEMAMRNTRFTSALVELADALACSSEPDVRSLVDEILSRRSVEPVPKGRAHTDLLVDLVRRDVRIAEAGLSDIAWSALTAAPETFDPGASQRSRRELADRLDAAGEDAPAPGF